MIGLIKLSFGLLNDTNKQAITAKLADAKQYSKLNLNEIIQVDFPETQYYKKETQKKQIVLHHTVSGQGTEGDIAYWRSTVERVGTAIIVGWDGKIYQCFSTLYWAHHLGVTAAWLKEKGLEDLYDSDLNKEEQVIAILEYFDEKNSELPDDDIPF